MITYRDAIMSLAPNVDFAVNGEEIAEWGSEDVSQPSHEDILAEKSRLQTEYDNLEYARDREIAYPSTKEFMEAYTEKEIGGDSTKWDAYVVKYNQVRTDNPKPGE